MTKLVVLVYVYVWRDVHCLPFGHTMLNGREARSLRRHCGQRSVLSYLTVSLLTDHKEIIRRELQEEV
jgi:hypothetical protein